MSSPVLRDDRRGLRGFWPLLTFSAVVVLVVLGQARGMWLSNLHNGVLGVAFAAVGAYLCVQRPGQREGRLFLATGLVEAVMFYGRQVGHTPTQRGAGWLAWLGVWPLAVALALTTLSVLCFPDGRLPSARWRGVAVAVVVIAGLCAALSAIWPVEYASTGMTTVHPINETAPAAVASLWSAVAHPAYVGFQVLWLAAVAARWRSSRGHVRFQLACLAIAAFGSVVALLVGLALWQTARPGILLVSLVPVAAGWAIVRGEHLAAYAALSWLSRAGAGAKDLPNELAAALSRALVAPSATLWIGNDTMHAIGVWPPGDTRIEPAEVATLSLAPGRHVRAVTKEGRTIGALSVDRPGPSPLSAAEGRLFDDLAGQASFVIEHLGLADLAARGRSVAPLEHLTPRENDVLALLAQGLSNAAIGKELHLSLKTVEPVVSSIFTKLGLHQDSASNRRVLAALAYLRS